MKTNAARTVRGDLAPLYKRALGANSLSPTENHKTQPALAVPLIQDALHARASDVHIEPQTRDCRLRFRIDGIVCDVGNISKEAGQLLINQFKAIAGLDPIIRFTPRDAHARVAHNGSATDIRLPVPRAVSKATGCSKCENLGYVGRTGVFEFWQLDGVDHEMILSHATEHDLREHLAKREHDSLLTDGLSKVIEGVTTLSELRKMIGAPIPGKL